MENFKILADGQEVGEERKLRVKYDFLISGSQI
jgi:hypothetical protein